MKALIGIAAVMLAAGCSGGGGSSAQPTVPAPVVSMGVGFNYPASDSPPNQVLYTFSATPSGATGKTVSFTIAETYKGASFPGPYTVTPEAGTASCISLTGTDPNYTAVSTCSSTPDNGTYLVTDSAGRTANMAVTALP